MRTDPTAAGAGLDPHRIAEIIVSGAKGGRRGSGYRINTNAFLTAAHVVAGATELRVRCDADRPGEWTAPAVVSWADEEHDLAVLTVTVPAQAAPTVEPVRFGRIPEDQHSVVEVHTAGFPLYKQRTSGGRVFRDQVVALGRTAGLSNLREGKLELVVDPPGADPDKNVSPWSGMSGAAVWAGEHIIGVVAEHHRAEGLGRLSAVRFDQVLRRLRTDSRAELVRLLGMPDPTGAPLAVPGDPAGGVRVVGVPVAYGIELFKNRTRERDEIAGHLTNPAVRMVTVTGRRGIGKSALAAKVMDLIERGDWPGPVRGPLPYGLVNISSRTSGISLERLYFDCARLLGPEEETRLRDTWSAGGTAPERLGELFEAIGERLIVILLDNLEDLLHDDGSIADPDLDVFVDYLCRAQNAPRLLMTSQVPVRLKPELRRFAAQVEVSEGLGPAEAVVLLRELDGDGSLGIAGLSDDELLQAAVRVHGVPRALELLVGAVADDSVFLPTLQEVLADFTRRHDVVAALAHARQSRLDQEPRAVLGVLAALRTPVAQRAVEDIVGKLDPQLRVRPALAQLVRVHLVSADRTSRTLALHPLDADLAYEEFPQHGPFGRQSVERQIASWYAREGQPREEWRTWDDLEPQRRQFDHLVRADDHDGAARVLCDISEWLVWHGSVLAAVAMHLAVDGHIEDEQVRLAHLAAYGHARLSAGPMEQAVDLFAQAADLAERLGDRSALQNALFGLGDAQRQIGDLDAVVTTLARAADLAHELGDTEREEHTLLSLSLTYSYRGDGAEALDIADRLMAAARSSGDPLTEARAGNARTIALLTLDRWQETVESGAETARAYRAADSQEAVAYALNAQGLGLIGLERAERAVEVLKEAFHEASLMENPRAEGVCLLNLAWAYWCDDSHDQCAATADRASAALRKAGASQAPAAPALAEAARALPGDRRTAADALTMAAAALDGNAEVVRAGWFAGRAERLRED
ncbi:trypsin-like peptidase domain-containing protein [Streptomyces boluensis]|uniref:Uncharacterized protein n=1 Tax=Streptomyces boluensis TaxID=1775135 RepID=A0A964UWK7_9ACTN|nr:trypsin-like peptidase domain-containing protein [Streptomyces boluensis]NBE55603.1 hypothetical protein [Streptomyces boluensis]